MASDGNHQSRDSAFKPVISAVSAKVRARRAHSVRDRAVRLTPTGEERVPKLVPVFGLLEGCIGAVIRHPLKPVRRLNYATLGLNIEPERVCDWCSRLLRALEGRCEQSGNRAIIFSDCGGRSLRHDLAPLREPKTRESPVEHPIGIEHLAVAHQVQTLLTHLTILRMPVWVFASQEATLGMRTSPSAWRRPDRLTR